MEEQLTRHERLVLTELVKNARTSDIMIAEKLEISAQAVGKIRHKLENEGIILSYNVAIQPERIGLHIVALASLYIPIDLFEKDYEFINTVKAEPPLIEAFKLMHGKANFQMTYSFRNLEECEAYFTAFKKNYPRVEILELQTSTWQKMLKHTKKDTFYWALTSKEIPIPLSTAQSVAQKERKKKLQKNKS